MFANDFTAANSTDRSQTNYADNECYKLLEISEILFGRKLKVRVPERALGPRRSWKLRATGDAPQGKERLSESSGADLDTANNSTNELSESRTASCCTYTVEAPKSPDDVEALATCESLQLPDPSLLEHTSLLLDYPEFLTGEFVPGRPWDGVTDLLTEVQPESPSPPPEVDPLEAEKEQYGRHCQALAWEQGKIWTWASALKYEPPNPAAVHDLPAATAYVAPLGPWQYFFACLERMQALKLERTYAMVVCPPQ